MAEFKREQSCLKKHARILSRLLQLDEKHLENDKKKRMQISITANIWLWVARPVENRDTYTRDICDMRGQLPQLVNFRKLGNRQHLYLKNRPFWAVGCTAYQGYYRAHVISKTLYKSNGMRVNRTYHGGTTNT